MKSRERTKVKKNRLAFWVIRIYDENINTRRGRDI